MKRCLTAASRPPRLAAIDMAPLIDMVFLLLVFYVVTASFDPGAAVPVRRPESAQAAPVAGPRLAVALTRDGAAFVDGRPARADLREAVARALRARGTRRVLLYADRAAPTGALLRTMDACRAAGAEDVEVAAVKGGR